MTLFITNHKFHYEMENLCRVFFPHEDIQKIYGVPDGTSKFFVATKLSPAEKGFLIEVEACREDKELRDSAVVWGKDDELELKMAVILFGLLIELTGYRPDWGVLTGVRPAKLMRKLRDEYGLDKAKWYFKESLLVTDKKISLAAEVEHHQRRIIDNNGAKDFSLYISIPFCPTRCSYCSFVSHSMDKVQKLLPEYLEHLKREIGYTADIMKRLDMNLRSVYIGGGTPTTLSAGQLDELTECLEKNFNVSEAEEYTIEAGRPDTITEEKLNVMMSRGVTRISINPQTLNDEVLAEIGRKHTSKQTVEAYTLARKCGFKNINMDLIAGLPKDTLESFKSTVDRVMQLEPESVTVHTLALKRSSSIVMNDGYSYTTEAELTSRQLDVVTNAMEQNRYYPYYMYRQSRTVGNLENVGYAKDGRECTYNVYMMDETHTVAACGAGAVTKLKDPGSDRIERVYDFKYPYEYISRFNEMLERKNYIRTFYEEIGCVE